MACTHIGDKCRYTPITNHTPPTKYLYNLFHVQVLICHLTSNNTIKKEKHENIESST